MSAILSFGNKLRNIRIMKDLQIKDVAEKAGVSVMYISEIERDKKIPSDELIAKLSEIYEVDEKELFEGFKRVSEDMLNELIEHPDLFDLVFEVSRGNLNQEQKDILYKQIHNFYNEILKK